MASKARPNHSRRVATETLLLLAAIGLSAGVLSGLFGIGGGVIIVPALIYVVGFNQRMAAGTSLAVLLAPIGIGAVTEYYRQGNVDAPAAVILALTVMAGALLGAVLSADVREGYLRLGFAGFVLLLGLFMVAGALRRLGGA